MPPKYIRTEVYRKNKEYISMYRTFPFYLSRKIISGCTFRLYVSMTVLTLEMCLPYILLDPDNLARKNRGNHHH